MNFHTYSNTCKYLENLKNKIAQIMITRTVDLGGSTIVGLCAILNWNHMICIMRKPDFCLCENKDADQLCSNCTADQRICFRYFSFSNVKIQAYSHLLWLHRLVCGRPGWNPPPKPPKTGFLMPWHTGRISSWMMHYHKDSSIPDAFILSLCLHSYPIHG